MEYKIVEYGCLNELQKIKQYNCLKRDWSAEAFSNNWVAISLQKSIVEVDNN